MDGQALYAIHREMTAEMLGWVLPLWEELDWAKQIRWEDRAVEQGLRDCGTLPEVQDD